MPDAKKAKLILERAQEQGRGLTDEELISYTMSKLQARRKEAKGGRPPKRWECPGCGNIFIGRDLFRRHRRECK